MARGREKTQFQPLSNLHPFAELDPHFGSVSQDGKIEFGINRLARTYKMNNRNKLVIKYFIFFNFSILSFSSLMHILLPPWNYMRIAHSICHAVNTAYRLLRVCV